MTCEAIEEVKTVIVQNETYERYRKEEKDAAKAYANNPTRINSGRFKAATLKRQSFMLGWMAAEAAHRKQDKKHERKQFSVKLKLK